MFRYGIFIFQILLPRAQIIRNAFMRVFFSYLNFAVKCYSVCKEIKKLRMKLLSVLRIPLIIKYKMIRKIIYLYKKLEKS